MQRILVVGIVRNCSKTLRSSIRAIEALFGGLGEISFFLVESDSSDQTLDLLGQLSDERRDVSFKSLGDLRTQIPERISRITKCRNEYLSHLRMLMQTGDSPDYVVVADFDGVNSKLFYNTSLGEVLRPDTVVTINQKGHYYDILALRSAGWVGEDYRIGVLRDIESGTDPIISFIKNVSKKQTNIKSSDKEIRVSSAFGGLAIYPAKPLSKCSYETTEIAPGIFECEHVKMHMDLTAEGLRVIIAPFLRNVGARSHVMLAGIPVQILAYILVYSGILGMVRKARSLLEKPDSRGTKPKK